MADVEYSTRAADWLRDAEPDVQERVLSKLEQAAEWPDHFLDALSGVPLYKLRVGDYRVIVDWRRRRRPLRAPDRSPPERVR